MAKTRSFKQTLRKSLLTACAGGLVAVATVALERKRDAGLRKRFTTPPDKQSPAV